MPSALRDIVTVLLTTVGAYVLVGVSFVGSFYALILLPEPVQATVCRGLFFCWPGLLLAIVVSTAVTLGVLTGLANRGSRTRGRRCCRGAVERCGVEQCGGGAV